MAQDELIDSHVSKSQCEKAITALLKHATKIAKQKENTELLPGKEENIWLVLSVKKVIPEKKLKPFKIPLAHPIVDPRTSSVCLITKDPQREYKDLLESHKIKFISRVVGVTKLKGKFKPFEARRMLLKENDLFLADDRVVPLLPKLLGKMFFNAKKQPIPVSLTKKDLKTELEQAISSTYMHQNQGTCTSIKIGTISQSPAILLENLQSALPAIVKRINGGWDNLQSFHIKTNSSTSLPVWLCDLGEGENGRWSEQKEMDEVKEQPGEESDADSEPTTKSATKKGKKRMAAEEVEQPSKKAKSISQPDVEKPSRKATKAKKNSTVDEESDSDGGPTTTSVTKKGQKRVVAEDSDPISKKAKKSQPKVEKSSQKPSKQSKNVKANEEGDSDEERTTSPAVAKGKKPITATESDSVGKKTKKPSKPKEENLGPTEPTKVTGHAAQSPAQAPLKSGHTSEEIKKKRAGESLSKKKEKVVKKRVGGSIKENVLGGKASSRM
ncbi:ribosomal protein L1 [Fomitiporia mediterranea MF3/22]|uniref:ribosomal protein L1 n=1 Tax=Fomitiporia mediterranea (strain MF3/22) TaxID=694068 RepID=UPI0004407560|nr:ribosomal protein L1 [Fomitiporia mediterranea MF3/22]EJC98145.1 ribosomal protein L1 [Fomitiporia mediterranea MF3/22]